jgi:hypothetical protein
MSDAAEYEFEPVRGLPEALPAGETMLWQGEPDAAALARGAFHVRAVAMYFGVLVAWRLAAGVADGEPFGTTLVAALWLAALAAAAVGVLAALAWLTARTTVYTITTRRIVIRFGIALPMTVNLPFRIVASAGLKRYPDGSGDIPLVLVPGERLSYLLMWPHVRPWRIARPEPMLRGIADAAPVARLLAGALAAAAGRPVARVSDPRESESPSPRPALNAAAGASR